MFQSFKHFNVVQQVAVENLFPLSYQGPFLVWMGSAGTKLF